MSATAVAPAYEHCRRVARESGSSFYTGMRLLPPDRRAALFAIYALARRIDDIADGDLPSRRRSSPSSSARARAADRPRRAPTTRCSSPSPTRRGASRSRSTRSATSSTAPRWTCARPSTSPSPISSATAAASPARSAASRSVSSTARTASGAAGSPTTSASRCRSATSLRDVREDLENGRVYLPREDLERFGCDDSRRRLHGPDRARARLRGAARALLARARPGPRPAARSPQRRLRARHGRQVPPPARPDRPEPALALRGRLSLRPWEKGLVLARSLTGSGA